MDSKTANILIDQFWQWFVQNELVFRRIPEDGETDLIDDVLNKLIVIQKGLAVELEKSDDIYSMTVSADGIEDNFEIVEKIIKRAPLHSKWNFIAFRQPYSKEKRKKIILKVYGYILDPKQIMFLPLEEGGKLYIQIFSADIQDDTKNEIGYGCLMLMDNLIGEYASVKKVDGYEFYGMSEATESKSDLRPLIEIPEYLDSYYNHK